LSQPEHFPASTWVTPPFELRRDRNGSFLWARSFGGVTTNAADLSIPAGLTVDSADAAYLTGQYYGTNVTFRPYNPTGLMPDSLGQNDGFLVKYHADGQLAGYELRITSIIQSNSNVIISWPGDPSIRLQRTTNLSNPDWQDVPGTTGADSAALPATNAAAFFRLLAP
jgi:hypothetical protein